jgi:hypothetical protein
LRPPAIAGLVLLVALVVGGVTIAALAAVELPRGVLEETSTPIPGSDEVRLEARKYNVFYDGSSTDEAIPPLRVLVTPAGGGAPLPLGDFGGSLNYGNAQAIGTVEVPREGAYRISTAGGPGLAGDPSVVLGEPIGKRILQVVLGAALAFLGLLGSILLVVISLVRRRRRAAGSP